MPLLAALFSALGVFGGYLVGVQLIGVDAGAFWSQDAGGGRLPARHRQRHHQERRVRHRGQPDRACSRATTRSRPPKACRARPRAPWSTSSLAILALDFVLTALHVPRHRTSTAQSELMNRSTIDLWVGIFVVARASRALAVPRAQGRQPASRSAARQPTTSTRAFDNIGGLKLRAPVQERRRGRRPRRSDPASTRRRYQARRDDDDRPAATSSRRTRSRRS